ncbi:hypothetical protein B6U84_01330 [Candidatus Bathyarchaeota archaeon ex4484_40]|nr:MAG: hypothetical protein B6U84_01330 [Candidatus Bathyarchaeota archaeon ex4484_40]
MSRVRVKICGITSQRDLLVAAEAGADAVGFVVDLPQSPRNLSTDKAKRLIRDTPVFVKTVVVTIPKNLSRLEEIYRELNPDVIQVHGITHMHKEIRGRLPDACLMKRQTHLTLSSWTLILQADMGAQVKFMIGSLVDVLGMSYIRSP